MRRYIITSVLSTILAVSAQAEEAPIERVVLSTSGLAQFEHRAHVKGDTVLELPVRLDQVDDVLKSLVVFDPKGRLGGVTLPGKQPLEQVFKDLPFTQAQLDNLPALLTAYRGTVVSAKGPAFDATGKILQVTQETESLGDNKTIIRHRLSLLTEDGVKQAVVEELQFLKFDDKKAQAELARALDSVRDNAATGKRTLAVTLLGKESRDAALSYVVPAPLWKTAYRLVVPAEGKEKGLLQGWAIIENMTAADWNNVDLSLVSGNPVTFRQALYQSYYARRPEVPVQVSGVTLPRVDRGGVAADALSSLAAESAAPQGAMRKAMRFNGAAAPMAMAAREVAEGVDMASTGAGDLASSVAVPTAETATQVLFRFPDRFSLKAGQSMMLPFISRDVPMERVFLYQPETDARHPLAAVSLRNDGETSLPAGVVTLYEDSALLKGLSFVGDAQLGSLTKGETRFVPYALDAKTVIDRTDKSASTEGKVSASGGIIRVAVKSRVETLYTIKAPEGEARTIVIETPRLSGDYKLVEPSPKEAEVTETHYRFKVQVAKGETKAFRTVLENQLWQSYGIDDLPVDRLEAWAAGGELSPAARKAFTELAAARRALDAIDTKIGALEQKRDALFRDQERIRENLRSLTAKSDVQQKYLDKLSAQEDEVGKLDRERQGLDAERAARLAEMRAKLEALEF